MSCKPLIDCSFPSTFGHVSSHLAKLDAEMDRRAVAASCKGDVLIVLGEVLNNIVEHAYSEAEEGQIELKAHTKDDTVYITTVDKGPPMPPNALSPAQLPEHSGALEDLPEGGFGWFMIHSLTDDMSYERVEGQNRLSFSILG